MSLINDIEKSRYEDFEYEEYLCNLLYDLVESFLPIVFPITSNRDKVESFRRVEQRVAYILG